MEIAEKNIISKLAKGDSQSFDYIYTRYVDSLLAYGKGFGFSDDELQDILHDLFLHFLSNPNVFNGIINIKAFMLRCLKNRLLDVLKSPYRFSDIEQYEVQFTIHVDVLDEIIDRERAEIISQKVSKLLNTLTFRQREAIYLRYMQDLSYDEIAEILELTPKGSRKLVARAIDHMRSSGEVQISIFIILHMIIKELELQ